MRILAVYPYLPWPLDRGTHHRTYHLLAELARAHEVTLVALDEKGLAGGHADVFHQFCRSVEVIPFAHPPWQKLFPHRLLNPLPPNVAHWTAPEVAGRLRAITQENRFDVVHVCDIVMAQYFLRAAEPLVIDRSRVDLQYQLAETRRLRLSAGNRLLRLEGCAKLWRFERRLARRASLQIVCGPDDADFVRRWVRRDTPLEVLVNGVDTEYFHPEPAAPRASQPSILFCGAMDYAPNVDAMRWFFSEIHDSLRRAVPNIETLIVGKNPTAEVVDFANRPGVTVTGGVPDVRPYYRRAWLQIVPLRIGGGTRLKIVESLSIGTPVVSTSIGAQGLSLPHEGEILLADSATDFIYQTVRALLDSELRARLSSAGIAAARNRFSWLTIGARLREIYNARFGSLLRQAAAAQVGDPKDAAAVRPPSLGLDPFGAGRR